MFQFLALTFLVIRTPGVSQLDSNKSSVSDNLTTEKNSGRGNAAVSSLQAFVLGGLFMASAVLHPIK